MSAEKRAEPFCSIVDTANVPAWLMKREEEGGSTATVKGVWRRNRDRLWVRVYLDSQPAFAVVVCGVGIFPQKGEIDGSWTHASDGELSVISDPDLFRPDRGDGCVSCPGYPEVGNLCARYLIRELPAFHDLYIRDTTVVRQCSLRTYRNPKPYEH